jgi:hypothetical protein
VVEPAWEGPDGEVEPLLSSTQTPISQNAVVLAEEEEEDGEPLVKGEDDIPKGCW